MRIAVVAPANRLNEDVPDKVHALAAARYGADAPDIMFHPQCFLQAGHFAGTDAQRADALVDVANDPTFDAVWFARGGYGSNRIASEVIGRLGKAARRKTYLGYSDMGFLLSALDRARIGKPVHGPMTTDIRRATGGDVCVARSLDWLMGRCAAPTGDYYFGTLDGSALSPAIALNMSVLGALLGTPLQPVFRNRVLMLEEVDEELYRIDRLMFEITSNRAVRQCAGIMLGNCSVKPNSGGPDWGPTDEVEIATRWCEKAGIPYLGRASIGHYADNHVVPFR